MRALASVAAALAAALCFAGSAILQQRAAGAAPDAESLRPDSLSVIDAVEPTVAVVLAATVLGEQVRLGAPALGAEALGALVALSGVFLLGRSPLVADLYGDAAGASRGRPRPAGAGRLAGQSATVTGKAS